MRNTRKNTSIYLVPLTVYSQNLRPSIGALSGSGIMQSLLEHSEPPLAMLERLVADQSNSGELIVASENLEAHIFLFRGAVAWATSSAAPNALTRHLVEDCQVDPALIREVIDDCKRTRKHFGETLIEWKVATYEQVRGALRRQVQEALASLAGIGLARTMFLPRRVTYRPDLTFSPSEVMPGTAPPPPAAADDELRGLVETTARSLPEALWVQALQGGAVVASSAKQDVSAPASLPAELWRTLATESAETMTVRSALGALLGQALPSNETSLWCALPPGAKLGLALAFLHAQARPSLPELERVEPGRKWSVQDDGRLLATHAPLEQAMSQSDELLAVLVMHRGSGRIATAHRDQYQIKEAIDCTRRVSPALDLSLRSCFLPGTSALGSVTYEQASIQLGCADRNYFLTTVGGSSGLLIAVVIQRQALQGLGWALLATLARQLADCAA